MCFTKSLRLLGFDYNILRNTLKGLPLFIRDFSKIKKQKGNDSLFYFGKKYPVFEDRYSSSGTMSGHYFHQDLFVARKIFQNNPTKHVDIGSRTDGFVAHVAVFREIEVFDIREQISKVRNIIFKQADLMKLPDNMVNYCDSISALHSIEHFGLGRYNDPIDYFGHLKALSNINKILMPGGKFYFSVPIGNQRIEFNAHRVFSIKYLMDLLEPEYIISSFSYVDDKGDFFEEITLSENDIKSNLNCKFGCGIFELTKKNTEE